MMGGRESEGILRKRKQKEPEIDVSTPCEGFISWETGDDTRTPLRSNHQLKPVIVPQINKTERKEHEFVWK